MRITLSDLGGIRSNKTTFLFRYDPDSVKPEPSQRYRNGLEIAKLTFQSSTLLLDLVRKRIRGLSIKGKPNLTRALTQLTSSLMKTIRPLLRSTQSGYHFRGRRLFQNYISHIQRLTNIKQALLDINLEMEVFLKSAAVWKTNVRQVAMCGEDAELMRILEHDVRLQEMRWYPKIV